MAKIVKIEKKDHLLEQYIVGTMEESFAVSDAKQMRDLVDPHGERKSFVVIFYGWLASLMDRCHFTPQEARPSSARVTAEELEYALQTAEDPTDFARLLTKSDWIEVYQMGMVSEDKFSDFVPRSKEGQQKVNRKIQIVNEDILDETEPTIYVQRYIYPQRTYQVHRKPTSEDEEFIISDDVENTEQRLWGVSTLLTEPYEPDDELFEIFADIYLDEENPPVVNPEESSPADPYGHVVYDTKMQLYRWEAVFKGYDDLEKVTAPTLQEAIEKGIATLEKLISGSLPPKL